VLSFMRGINTRTSRLQGALERLPSLVRVRPYRCSDCYCRFWRWL